jgi:outer membrane protein assembly factor BamB
VSPSQSSVPRCLPLHSLLVRATATALLLAAAAGMSLAACSGGGDRQRARPTTEQQHPRPAPSSNAIAWPTYGFDPERNHAVPNFALHPPFRVLWTQHGDWTFFEGPPVVANGRVYVGTNGGLVMGLDAARGIVVWKRNFHRCVAASPAVGHGLVYVPLMGPPPCRAEGGGGLVALDSRTGAVRWRARIGVVESPPLLARGTIYLGSWDAHVYALDAGSGRIRWRFATHDKVKSGAAYAQGTIYIGSYDGRLYALAASSGRLRWASPGGAFYATPAVAYGKVFAASTGGRVFAYSASDGRLVWSTSTRSYIYSAPAIWGHTVYVGSYDHRLYALDAQTGARRWSVDAGHPISGAPTVMDGLVYFSTCGSCSHFESDVHGRRSFAADARTGRVVWRFHDGEYSPVVADGQRVYLMGFTSLYGLAPKHARTRRTAGAR